MKTKLTKSERYIINDYTKTINKLVLNNIIKKFNEPCDIDKCSVDCPIFNICELSLKNKTIEINKIES